MGSRQKLLSEYPVSQEKVLKIFAESSLRKKEGKKLKKQLVLIFAVLLIVGFAIDVYAQTPAVANGDTQVTISGEMRIRGRIETMCETFDDVKGTDNGRATYDTKLRLGILAKVSPKTKMFLQLSGGASENNHSYRWGVSGYQGDAKGGFTTGNSLQTGVYVRNVWLEHTIADLITIKAGHQPIKIGWGLFYDHSLYGDDAIVVTAKPTKELSIAAITSKLDEGTHDARDANLYALALNYAPVKGTEVSFDASYLEDRTGNTIGLNSNLGANLSANNKQMGLWNYGARVKTKIAGLGLRGGIEIQRGEVKDDNNTVSDIKFKGMAAQLGASYDVTSDVVLDAEVGYGSGDDNGTTDNKVKTFVNSRGATTPLTFVYEDETVTSINRTNAYLANLMYGKISAKANLTKDLSADLRVYYLKAVKAPKSSVSSERYAFTYATDKKDIGVEVDLYTKYKLDKGLVYFLEGGYLFAGDYWKAVTGTTRSPKDPWAVKHGLELEF